MAARLVTGLGELLLRGCVAFALGVACLSAAGRV